MSLLRRTKDALSQFDTLRFLATSTKQRPRPAAARPVAASPPPAAPPAGPAPSSALQESSTVGEAWVEVYTPKGELYYWNKKTGETTAVGEARPGPEGRVQQRRVVQPGTSLIGLMGAGAGIGLVFALLGRLL